MEGIHGILLGIQILVSGIGVFVYLKLVTLNFLGDSTKEEILRNVKYVNYSVVVESVSLLIYTVIMLLIGVQIEDRVTAVGVLILLVFYILMKLYTTNKLIKSQVKSVS